MSIRDRLFWEEEARKMGIAKDVNVRVRRRNRNEALEDLAELAEIAIDHVGYANYTERQIEAKQWIRNKLAELTRKRKQVK